ncbi:MAG: acyl-CoA-binding protein [Rhodanobacteraceae bacterium]
MPELTQRFLQASEDAKKLPRRPEHDALLKLYALYKQGLEGDVRGTKPGFFDFIGTAKYEAWSQLKGMSGDDAMRKYIELAESLKALG